MLDNSSELVMVLKTLPYTRVCLGYNLPTYNYTIHCMCKFGTYNYTVYSETETTFVDHSNICYVPELNPRHQV